MRITFKRKITAACIACLLLTGLLLTGCSAPEVEVPATESTQLPTETTIAPTEAEIIETEETQQLATIANDDLTGIWIASAEPVISDDTQYTMTTNAGYYEFDGNGNFVFTQILLVQQGIWTQLGEPTIYKGIFELHGDLLTLHYTEEAGEPVDYTEDVSMVVDRSCADMCVRTPDHPKLGTLKFFRKARSGDPVNAITILLNGSL